MIHIEDIFGDTKLVEEIQEKLPKLFNIAEIESSRAEKIGMEVGSLREKIIIALLIYKFGSDYVNTKIPITEPETDVILNKNKISIKTITGNGGVKAVWTVDAQSAEKFIKGYTPKCDMILVQIFWGSENGGFFFIPLKLQQEVFKNLGKGAYLKMPKPGTNPRGVEFSKKAIKSMFMHKDIKRIKINWKKEKVDYNVHERWVKYWSGEEKLD